MGKNKKERADSGDSSSSEKALFKRNPRNRDEEDNKIEMDQFHRKIVKSKNRTTTDKKKIRDIERLLAKEGIP